jgi:cation transport ATPase
VRAAGPVVDPIPCSGCGNLLDPLRAGHVAIFDQRLHYFCNYDCREAYLRPFGGADTGSDAARDAIPKRRASEDPAAGSGPRRRVQAQRERGARESKAGEVSNALGPVVPEDVLPELPSFDDRGLVEPIGPTILSETPRHEPEPREFGALLLLIAVIAGALAVLLALAGGGTLVLGARVMLAAVAVGMLLARTLTTARDEADPHPVAVLSGPMLGVAVATWATLGGDASVASEAASLAGTIATAAAVSAWLLESARTYVHAERAWVQASLTLGGRLDPETAGLDAPQDPVLDLRTGEGIVVDADETVPADVVVTEGEVDVLPWLGAATPARRRAGDPIVAGARVIRGKLRATVTWAGLDRAFARVLFDPRRRVDALAPVTRASRSLAERWAPVAAVAAAAAAFFLHHTHVEVAMTFAAVQGGLATCIIGGLSGVYVARGVLLALRRGITYRSADAWERAARAQIGVFQARGTLLLGEPEVAEIEPMGSGVERDDLLALAAGAERTESHPVAHAILRAAKARGVRPDGVRNPNGYAGLGVVAVSSAGEELSVGNRTLMLEQRVSIATAEPRIGELESLGRSVVLVALGGRLAGLIALEDGIRPGARAAVQHLLDAQVEPVLMSGDSRETCEAIARSLDIEHIRPEVLPDERGEEIKRLAETGSSVAVIGHQGLDDGALGAADVAIALSAAGSPGGEFEIALASDDVRDAALALALARRTRIEARVGFGLAAIPAVLGVAIVALGILPPAFVPIASLLGGAMGVLHGRTLDRMRNPTEPSPS